MTKLTITLFLACLLFAGSAFAQPVQAPVVTTITPGAPVVICTYTNGVRYCTRY